MLRSRVTVGFVAPGGGEAHPEGRLHEDKGRDGGTQTGGQGWPERGSLGPSGVAHEQQACEADADGVVRDQPELLLFKYWGCGGDAVVGELPVSHVPDPPSDKSVVQRSNPRGAPDCFGSEVHGRCCAHADQRGPDCPIPQRVHVASPLLSVAADEVRPDSPCCLRVCHGHVYSVRAADLRLHSSKDRRSARSCHVLHCLAPLPVSRDTHEGRRARSVSGVMFPAPCHLRTGPRGS